MTDFVALNEVSNKTAKIEDFGTGGFAVTKAEQRAMLANYLNDAAERIDAAKASSERTGVKVQAVIPEVQITYTKVTKAKARKANQDYAAIPGVSYSAHEGPAVVVRRNKAGEPYFTLHDANRINAEGERGFSAIKFEGILSFRYADPKAQKAALGKARGYATGA